jgi:hypothetical protein
MYIYHIYIYYKCKPRPPSHLRWDVEKVAESGNFVALTKPAGMFVVTDERGLWEESSTNFIHVAHKRCHATLVKTAMG